MTSPEIKGQIRDSMDKMGISPDAIARAIVFAIEQPADADGGDYCPSHGAELIRAGLAIHILGTRRS